MDFNFSGLYSYKLITCVLACNDLAGGFFTFLTLLKFICDI